jgi:hypothetical protein
MAQDEAAKGKGALGLADDQGHDATPRLAD